MTTRISPNRLATIIAITAAALASTHATAADATMTIDARAPLAATLMPTVSVTADAANPDAAPQWHVADTRPLPVTLMPTVRVTAQADVLAVTLLPTVQVNARADTLAATLLPTVRVHAPADALAMDETPTAAPIVAQAPAIAATVRVATSPTVADSFVDRAGRPASQRNLEVTPR